MQDRLGPDENPARAFEIGITPVERDANWLRPFDGMARYLAEKDRVLDANPGLVYGDTGGTEGAQKEIFSLVSEHLLATFPQIYRQTGDAIEVCSDGTLRTLATDSDLPDIIKAAKLTGDDMALMRKTPDGWRLVCGCVCFPSAWNIPQKLGKIMADVHAPVPGFETGTRKAMLIERMFDNLPTGKTVQRCNWSLHGIDDLHLPRPEAGDFDDIGDIARMFFRGEVQTLTKLPPGTDILFTIGVYVDPLEHLKENSARAASLDAQLMALDSAQLDYKGLRRVRDRLHAHLSSMYRP